MTVKNLVGNNLTLNSTHNSDGEDITYNGYEIYTGSVGKRQSHPPITINGDLIISSDYQPNTSGFNISSVVQHLKRLDFYIREIKGNLIMKNNPYIQDLIFTNLIKVHGKIIIDGNSTLQSLNFPALTFCNILGITNNSKVGIVATGNKDRVHTLSNLTSMNFSELLTAGESVTIKNNELGVKKMNGSVLSQTNPSNTPCQLNLKKLRTVGTNSPYTYSNYVDINPYNTPTNQDTSTTTLNKIALISTYIPGSLPNISEKALDIGEGNRTFKLGMIFKSPNMTQGNTFNTMRHVYYKSTGNNNNKWFGTPTYKFTNLTKEQQNKPIITHKTGSSSDYMALKKARAIGDNTTKYGSTQDLQVSFSNSNSTNNNDIKSALSKLRNRGNVVPPKFRNK